MENEKYSMVHEISIKILSEEFDRNDKNEGKLLYKNQAYSIFGLIYAIENETLINIFYYDFYKKNKNNCKMIINNKLYLLSDKYNISDGNQKILKIKLMIIYNTKIDLSYMFYNCKSLKKFYGISKEENNFN